MGGFMPEMRASRTPRLRYEAMTAYIFMVSLTSFICIMFWCIS